MIPRFHVVEPHECRSSAEHCRFRATCWLHAVECKTRTCWRAHVPNAHMASHMHSQLWSNQINMFGHCSEIGAWCFCYARARPRTTRNHRSFIVFVCPMFCEHYHTPLGLINCGHGFENIARASDNCDADGRSVGRLPVRTFTHNNYAMMLLDSQHAPGFAYYVRYVLHMKFKRSVTHVHTRANRLIGAGPVNVHPFECTARANTMCWFVLCVCVAICGGSDGSHATQIPTSCCALCVLFAFPMCDCPNERISVFARVRAFFMRKTLQVNNIVQMHVCMDIQIVCNLMRTYCDGGREISCLDANIVEHPQQPTVWS